MRCPQCGHDPLKTLRSVSRPEKWIVRRQRLCVKCKRQFTTYELLEAEFLELERRRDVINELQMLMDKKGWKSEDPKS